MFTLIIVLTSIREVITDFFFNHHCLSWFPFLCGGLRLENKMHYKKNTMAPIIIAIQWVCLLRGKIKYFIYMNRIHLVLYTKHGIIH